MKGKESMISLFHSRLSAHCFVVFILVFYELLMCGHIFFEKRDEECEKSSY